MCALWITQGQVFADPVYTIWFGEPLVSDRPLAYNEPLPLSSFEFVFAQPQISVARQLVLRRPLWPSHKFVVDFPVTLEVQAT